MINNKPELYYTGFLIKDRQIKEIDENKKERLTPKARSLDATASQLYEMAERGECRLFQKQIYAGSNSKDPIYEYYVVYGKFPKMHFGARP